MVTMFSISRAEHYYDEHITAQLSLGHNTRCWMVTARRHYHHVVGERQHVGVVIVTGDGSIVSHRREGSEYAGNEDAA